MQPPFFHVGSEAGDASGSIYPHVPYPDKVYIYWNGTGGARGRLKLDFTGQSTMTVYIDRNEEIRIASCDGPDDWWGAASGQTLPYPPSPSTHAEPALVCGYTNGLGSDVYERVDLLVIQVPPNSQGVLERITFLPYADSTFYVFDLVVHSVGEAHALQTMSRDGDGDGADDLWEYAVFNTTTGVTAQSDADADGFRDVYEFRAGTDPLDPDSMLCITAPSNAPAITGGDGVTITWQSHAGHRYSVLRASDLTTGFTVITSGIPGLAGATSRTQYLWPHH